MYSRNIVNAVVTNVGIGPSSPGSFYSSAVALNLGAGTVTLREADAQAGPFTDVDGGVGILTNQSAVVKITKPWVTISNGVGNVVLIGL